MWYLGDDAAAIYSGPFLREEVMALKGLNVISESAACSVSNRISNSNSLPFSSRAYAWWEKKTLWAILAKNMMQ